MQVSVWGAGVVEDMVVVPRGGGGCVNNVEIYIFERWVDISCLGAGLRNRAPKAKSGA